MDTALKQALTKALDAALVKTMKSESRPDRHDGAETLVVLLESCLDPDWLKANRAAVEQVALHTMTNVWQMADDFRSRNATAGVASTATRLAQHLVQHP